MGKKKKGKKAGRKKGIRYVLGLLAILVSLMIFVGVRRLELQYHYVITSAKVIDLKNTTSKGAMRNTVPYSTVVTYEFYVDEVRYTGSHNISGSSFLRGMPIQSNSITEVPVRYSKFFPSINEVYFGGEPRKDN